VVAAFCLRPRRVLPQGLFKFTDARPDRCHRPLHRQYFRNGFMRHRRRSNSEAGMVNQLLDDCRRSGLPHPNARSTGPEKPGMELGEPPGDRQILGGRKWNCFATPEFSC
jgi:hypothetical protein